MLEKEFFERGAAAFERDTSREQTRAERCAQALEEKLERKTAMLAELMEEHVQSTKELGEP